MSDAHSFAYISAMGLFSIRIGAALRFVPFFGGGPLPLLPWLGLTLALALLLTPQSGPLGAIGAHGWIALAVKELFIGVVIGTLARIAFSVLDVVGDLARISSLSIPRVETADFSRVSPLTGAYVLLATAVFLVADGHHALLSGLAKTAQCLPPLNMPGIQPLAAGGSSAALILFSAAMASAVMIAAPIFLAGIAADILIGLVSRFAAGTAATGAQTVRLLFVQFMVIASLGLVVSTAINFLQTSMEQLSICQTAIP